MKIAIVGATGVVGETLLTVLAERCIELEALGLFARHARAQELVYRGRSWPVKAADAQAIRAGRFDVVFFASSDDAAADLAACAVDSGAIVIDNSATFRAAADIPLIVPEINPELVHSSTRIFPVANCTAILLCVGIAPIARTAGLRSVRVATYQAVSGAGRAGLDALESEERGLGAPSPFAARIHRNVVPQIGESDESGNSSEERKIVAETRKILGLPALHVAATTVRVPVRRAHAEAVFVETLRDTSVDELAHALAGAPGVVFHPSGITTPLDIEGDDRVHVARLRAEGESRRHFQLWIAGDQLRKGAATNAVQILEMLIARGLVSGAPQPVSP